MIIEKEPLNTKSTTKTCSSTATGLDAEWESFLASLPTDDNPETPKIPDKSQSFIKKIIKLTPSSPELFPIKSIEELPGHEKPLERLDELFEELIQHGNYYLIRDEFCTLSVTLNIQGKIAPAFRPQPHTKKKFGDKVFMQIHRDQIVIDCHWLHTTKQKVNLRPKDKEYRSLFSASKPFPFHQAWDFAQEKWSSDHRAQGMFRLTMFQQVQLATLQSKTTKEFIQSLDHGTRASGRYIPSPISDFEIKFSEWCERDKRMSKHRGDYFAIWLARILLGSSEKIGPSQNLLR